MPEISRFYGIIIYMYGKDHNPPHFHAKYGEFMGVIDIETGKLIEGKLPTRAKRLVKEWMELHRAELMLDWLESQKDDGNIKGIDPLL